VTSEAIFEVVFIVGPHGNDPVEVNFEPIGMMYRVGARRVSSSENFRVESCSSRDMAPAI